MTVSSDYQVWDAPLVKNTNYFSCILQDENNNLLNREDFTFTLEAANGVMDYTNTPSDTEPVYYRPYRQEVSVLSDDIPVIHARLNTLRIMKGDQTTLSIKHIPSGQEILRLPLTQYLLLSKSTVIPVMRWTTRNILTGRIHIHFYFSSNHRIWGFRRYARK